MYNMAQAKVSDFFRATKQNSSYSIKRRKAIESPLVCKQPEKFESGLDEHYLKPASGFDNTQVIKHGKGKSRQAQNKHVITSNRLHRKKSSAGSSTSESQVSIDKAFENAFRTFSDKTNPIKCNEFDECSYDDIERYNDWSPRRKTNIHIKPSNDKTDDNDVRKYKVAARRARIKLDTPSIVQNKKSSTALNFQEVGIVSSTCSEYEVSYYYMNMLFL